MLILYKLLQKNKIKIKSVNVRLPIVPKVKKNRRIYKYIYITIMSIIIVKYISKHAG